MLSTVRLAARKRCPYIFARHASTSLKNDASKLRNIALVAHIDSGKTTLTESILLSSNYLSSSGSVDTGSTTTDFLPAERERGITIQSASIPVKWKDWTFNLIDTPGHADFGMEVESASRVIDGAVVLIDSVEGVEAQTRGVWGQLDRYGVQSRMMFFNKLDRPGASFRSSLLSLLGHRLHHKPVALTLPIASFDPLEYTRGEPGVEGLVDLIKWQLWKWEEDGTKSCYDLPQSTEQLSNLPYLPSSHPIISHLVPARTELMDNLSMLSEPFLELLLNLPPNPDAYLGVTASQILPVLRAATLKNEILPVVCGSAMKHIGTELAMTYVGELLPSPNDVDHDKQTPNAPLRMLAWKVTWDPRRGWMTFVRVYSGTLTRQSVLYNTTRNEKERVSKLLLLYASEAEEVDSLSFGQVGVVLGLRFTRTGDTLTSTREAHTKHSILRDIVPPPPVMSASIIPQSHSDLVPVQEALESLSRTDPSVRVDLQEGQILVHGLGALHLEIVENRLRDEWKAQFEFGQRRVSYRETLESHEAEDIEETWNSEVSGKPVSITLKLRLRRLMDDEPGDPAWDGNVVLDERGTAYTSPEAAPGTAASYIARGLASTLSNSPNSSLALTGICVEVVSCDYAPTTPLTALTGASAIILRNYLRSKGLGPLMEPFSTLKISVPESAFGKVVKDLTESGGELLSLGTGTSSGSDESDDIDGFSTDGVYVPPEWMSPSATRLMSSSSSAPQRRSIHAVAPLSRLLDYANRLRALSGGHGAFEMASSGFRQVSDGRKLDILREIGRA